MMTQAVSEVFLKPEAEAERLWRGSREAFEKSSDSIIYLIEAIDLGVRVVEITTAHCLQTLRHEFPATIASLLEAPPPEVDPVRDFLHPPKALSFLDVVDMLSEEMLPCVSLKLHHGWEDRVESCRRSRIRTKAATGISLDRREREALALIGAYRNRIFNLPPPVRVVTGDVVGAFPTLVSLAERLLEAAKRA